MRIFLAGGEAWWERFRDNGIRYILVSYHYLRTQRDFSEMIEWMEHAKREGYREGDTVHPYVFMLDSGAFTFKVKGDPDDQLESYADDYIRFLQTDPAADVFDIVAELDVDLDVMDAQGNVLVDGYERMLDWRDRLYGIVGNRLMPVHGLNFHKDDWTALCEDPKYKYLGISSGLSADMGYQRRLMGEAHQYGKWVHGFGMTRLQTDMKYLTRYESVDSTTWLRADKYGGTFIARKGSLVILDHKHKHLRKNYRRYFQKIGCDPDKILGVHRKHAPVCPGPDSQTTNCNACRDQLLELRRSSLIAWRNLTYYYERFNDKGTARTPPYLAQGAESGTTRVHSQERTEERTIRVTDRRAAEPGNGESPGISPGQEPGGHSTHTDVRHKERRTHDRKATVGGGMKRGKGKRKKKGWNATSRNDGGVRDVAEKDDLSEESAGGTNTRSVDLGTRTRTERGGDERSHAEAGGDGETRKAGKRRGGSVEGSEQRDSAEGRPRLQDDSAAGRAGGDREELAVGDSGQDHQRDRHQKVPDPTSHFRATAERLEGERSDLGGAKRRREDGSVRDGGPGITRTATGQEKLRKAGKGKKGWDHQDKRTIPFGGYSCPHYRRRPPEVMANLNCRACTNLGACAGLEDDARPATEHAAPRVNLETEPTPPEESTPPPPSAGRAVPSLENLRQGAPDYLQEGGALEHAAQDVARKSPPASSVTTAQFQPGDEDSASKSSNAALGVVSELVPITHRLPMVTTGGINLGAFRQGMPRIECSNCSISEDCPKWEPGAVCAFNELFDQFDTRNSDDLYAVQQMLVELDLDRTMKSVLLERLTTGGVVDPKVTSQMDSLQRRVQLLHEMQVSRSPGGRADGRPSVHLHHHMPGTVDSQPGGVLTRIFSSATEDDKKVLDVPAEEKPPREPDK